MDSFGLSRPHHPCHQTAYPLFHSMGAKITCSPPLSVICSDHSQFPTYDEFKDIIEDYLENLSPKKRDKALVDNHRYQLILQVLKDPKNTSVSTAQFRFWVKKMFKLAAQVDTADVIFHDKKPVATKEKIYDILVRAHGEVHHGGRDKTSALVRRRFSWIPKELIARFVRNCPFCVSRRNGSQSPIDSDIKLPSPTSSFSEPTLSTAPTTPVDYDSTPEEFEMKPEQSLFRGVDEHTPPLSPVSSYKPLDTDIDLENSVYLSTGTEASSSDITPGLGVCGYGSVPYSYSYRTTARYPMLPSAFPVDLAMSMSTMEPQLTHRHPEYQHQTYAYGQDILGMTTGEHPVSERARGGSEGVSILSHQQQYLRNYHAQQAYYLHHHMRARLADCMVIRNGLIADGGVNRDGYQDQAF